MKGFTSVCDILKFVKPNNGKYHFYIGKECVLSIADMDNEAAAIEHFGAEKAKRLHPDGLKYFSIQWSPDWRGLQCDFETVYYEGTWYDREKHLRRIERRAKKIALQLVKTMKLDVEAQIPNMFVNQAEREYNEVAHDGGLTLIEYTMPKGTTAMRIYNVFGDYKNVSYKALSPRWRALVAEHGIGLVENSQ